MASPTLAPPEAGQGSGGNDSGGMGGFWDGGSGGGGSSDDYDAFLRDRACRTGIWVTLAGIVMLFAALTSALVVRRGLSNDWKPTPLPAAMWINTLVLAASSATLARARSLFSAGRVAAFNTWWTATIGLGFAFILGQYFAWRVLASKGFYLASNPSSSFFYLMTAAHGIHLLGGIGALLYVTLRVRQSLVTRTAVDVTAVYWHFMDGLWIYLFLLLLWGRWF